MVSLRIRLDGDEATFCEIGASQTFDLPQTKPLQSNKVSGQQLCCIFCEQSLIRLPGTEQASASYVFVAPIDSKRLHTCRQSTGNLPVPPNSGTGNGPNVRQIYGVEIFTGVFNRTKTDRAWHMPAMLGCSTVCPNCKHQFTCCAPIPPCCSSRRSVVLSGGGVMTTLPPCPSPQVSPSVPLTFVLPPFVTPPSPPPVVGPEMDMVRLTDTVRVLRLSGWYYEGLTFEKSDELLKNTPVGTFLVRDSSNPRFLFSLSVQTDRGPKSVRLFYINGYFRLDAQPHLQPSMPLFPGVLELVQHYVCRKKDAQVWLDQQGKCLSSIVLDKPLLKEGKPPTLKHLARLAINKQLKNASKVKIFKLELPTSLTTYLAEYPYSL